MRDRWRGVISICAWSADVFDHLNNMCGRCRSEVAYDSCDKEVDEHADATDALRGDSKEPLGFDTTEELEVDDVTCGESDACYHSRNGTFPVDAFRENPHEQSGEKG